MTTTLESPPTHFRPLPFMGVIRVNMEAMKSGFTMGAEDWANLGQGQPEIGVLPDAPPRLGRLDVQVADHGYGPVEGIDELRDAVAAHYNRLYRADHASKYTRENVMISPGGRSGLTRCATALDRVRLGYFTPDYTAYEDLLCSFPHITPVGIHLEPEEGFDLAAPAFEERVVAERLDVALFSNPCNPTGVVVRGDDLAGRVDVARRHGCTLLSDEFYSHYVYGDNPEPVSCARYVEDVNRDPVVIFDGLTKCYRYPGWRVGWIVAPTSVIRDLTAAGSFLDGGPSRPIQRLAVQALEPVQADTETNAMRAAFTRKRAIVLDGLRRMGIDVPVEPAGTFYVWASLANLPAPLNDGEAFMRAAFEHRVLTVPGASFDIDPTKERDPARLAQWMRFSYGPPETTVAAGIERLVEMVEAAR